MKGLFFMDNYDQLNEILVYLFDHALDIERNFLIRDTFKDISVNDMHVINAIGLHNEVNMSSLAKKVGVTVGTLTIAINGLVRKEYVLRTRSETDRRVVLVSLTEKGESAFRHHEDFHTRIVDAIHASLTEEESVSLVLAWNEHAEGTAASDVQWIMCRGRDHLGYQKEEKRQIEGRGTMTYVPDLSVFADGEVTFSFWAVDQAGNTGEEAQIVLMKDSTCPVITGRLDTKGRRVGDFYSDSCQVSIFVQDENFDFSYRPSVQTENGDGYSFSGWRRNGDKAEGVMTFDGEGTYQLTFSCRDLAGNEAETLVVPEFTIDRTAPEVSVKFNESDSHHETYYNQVRKALITVNEQWFRPEDGRITVVSGGEEKKVTEIDWVKTDQGYQSEILFERDGMNALTIEWSDPAGNQAKRYQSGAFVLDTVKPELSIKGVEAYSSNNGKVEPVIDIYDVNLDEGEVTVALDELTGKKVEMPEVERQETDTHHLQLAMGDFGSGMDGIYRLSVHAADLAGNDDEAELFFTVNRNGSYYAFDQKTEAMVQKVFISSPEKVVIYENNMDWLTDSSVILSCNGSLRELKPEKDYTIEAVGNETSRKQYTYTIDEKCFSREGTYSLYLDSKDRASNYSSAEQQAQTIGFIVDRTAPRISIINLEEQQYYHGTSHNFQVTVDDNTQLSCVKYYLDGRLEEQFSKDEIEEAERLLELQTGASDEYQTIRIVAEDKAGNTADSGEWHVLVNTSDRTRKFKNHTEQSRTQWRQNSAEPEKQQDNDRQAAGLIAGIVCVILVGGVVWYRHEQKKKVSIRRLPDTDDRK